MKAPTQALGITDFAAIEALARGLAADPEPDLRANCIAPGMVRSPLHDRLPEARREAAFAAVMAATNGYLTGAVIDVDGGHMVRQYAAAG